MTAALTLLLLNNIMFSSAESEQRLIGCLFGSQCRCEEFCRLVVESLGQFGDGIGHMTADDFNKLLRLSIGQFFRQGLGLLQSSFL